MIRLTELYRIDLHLSYLRRIRFLNKLNRFNFNCFIVSMLVVSFHYDIVNYNTFQLVQKPILVHQPIPFQNQRKRDKNQYFRNRVMYSCENRTEYFSRIVHAKL